MEITVPDAEGLGFSLKLPDAEGHALDACQTKNLESQCPSTFAI